MNGKYTEYKKNPELLKGRFEGSFPLLYPMDTVKVSSRWSGKEKNYLEGRLGYVHKIGHGLQSIFNRDYLILSLMGGKELGNDEGFGSWIYTLDLVEKDETTKISDSILKQFGCLLYVDDRVRVVRHPHDEGKVGVVNLLQGTGSEGGWLGLEIIDETIIEKVKQHHVNLNKRVAQEFQMRDVPQKFDDFILRVKDKSLEFYHSLEKDGIIRKTYEGLLRDEIYKELATKPEFQRELMNLEKRARFFVSSKDIELIERFPPNDLFKVPNKKEYKVN